MIVIDEQKIFEVILEKKPISVAINGPDGILPKIQETAQHIMEKFDIPAFVLGDTTWGTCDLNSNGAKVLGAEILFNVGHTNKLDTEFITHVNLNPAKPHIVIVIHHPSDEAEKSWNRTEGAKMYNRFTDFFEHMNMPEVDGIPVERTIRFVPMDSYKYDRSLR